MTARTPRLVLASSSPARRRLLRDAGFAPVVDISGADETFDAALGTASAVCVLAERKASAVAGRHPGALVLGCDSLLDLDGTAQGKPASPQAAAEVWRRMSGRHGTLHTGHCLIDMRSGQRTLAAASTVVRFGTPGGAGDRRLRGHGGAGPDGGGVQHRWLRCAVRGRHRW